MENIISTHTLPVICTRGVILFPESEKTIDVGRKKSLDAIKVAQQDFNSRIVLVSQMNPEIFDPKDYELYKFGTICSIKNVQSYRSAPEIPLPAVLLCFRRSQMYGSSLTQNCRKFPVCNNKRCHC